MLQDRYGLALSTSSEAAASAYRDGIDLMLAAWPGAEGTLDAAIAADPGFALAHAGRARMHYLYADGRAAKAKAATARELVARNGSDREKSHVEALALGIEGQPAKSLERALAHLDNWPRDAVIMSLPLGAFAGAALPSRCLVTMARAGSRMQDPLRWRASGGTLRPQKRAVRMRTPRKISRTALREGPWRRQGSTAISIRPSVVRAPRCCPISTITGKSRW